MMFEGVVNKIHGKDDATTFPRRTGDANRKCYPSATPARADPFGGNRRRRVLPTQVGG